MKRIVITPDLQIPFHNPKQVAAHLRFIGEYQPDMVIQIGDLTDFPQPSRWNKDTKGEFEGTTWRDAELTKRTYFEPLRKVFSGSVGMHIGNHDVRPLNYQKRYAPALDTKKDEDNPYYYGRLLDFDGFGVQDLAGYYDVAPGWVTTHGHLGIPLRHVAGNTAMSGARKIDKSLVMGHTHRLGIVRETFGYSGKSKTLTGLEVGHMMDVKKADYIMRKTGMANWQAGFGVLYVDRGTVTAVAVPVNRDGSFVFEGKRWE